MPLLIQIPGLAPLSAMTVLAAIGDISRFPTDKQFVGYAGLGAGVRDSGESHHDGHISKQGRRDLRRVLIEAAWSAVNAHPYWKGEFARLCRHKPQGVAIVAIARKLLVAVWHVLTEGCADRFTEPEIVARKLLQHAYRLGAENRPDGQSTAEYVREQLDRLGLGADLTAIPRGQRNVPLPPSCLATGGD